MPPPSRIAFSSTEGQKLVRNLLRTLLPYDPHDHQLEGICKALDGIDLLATIATGAGKTGYFTMTMLVVLALQRDEALAARFTRTFPSHPAAIIIYPTNGLEEEMVSLRQLDICVF